MKRLLFLSLLIILFSATDLWAVAGVTDTEIILGMVNAQSGPAAALGKGMFSGANAVFSEINSKGGINGRKIRLLLADDGYEPNRAIDETIKMIEEKKVFSLFGYVGTPTANAVIAIVKDMKVPLVGLFTGAMTLREPVIPEIINIRASYDDEAEALVDYLIKTKNAKTFGVFYQDDGFGQAVLMGTEKALRKRGMSVSARGTFQRNTVAIKAGLSEILTANPDAVIMVGPYTPVAEFIKAAKTEGLKASLATVSFVGTENLVEKVGTAGEGVIISQVVPFPYDLSLPLTEECDSLVRKYSPQEKFGFVNFEGCISAKVMALGLEKAGSALTREGLLKALEDMNNVDMNGVVLKLGKNNHQAMDTVFRTVIVDGRVHKLK